MMSFSNNIYGEISFNHTSCEYPEMPHIGEFIGE